MLGDGYIAQHIFNQARHENQERNYRLYVTDALYAISGNGKMTRRWADIMADLEKPREMRSAQEIKSHIMAKLNRKEV